MLTAACLPAAALSQATPDPMEVCFQISDAGARVACFDREMQRRHAAAAAAAPAVTAAPAVPAAPAAAAVAPAAKPKAVDDTVGLDGRQLIIRRKEEGIKSPAVEPIVAVLARLVEHPGHQYHFELDNGQVWESTDTVPALFLSPRETVTIRPGVLGAFFLKTREGNSIRVHRLR
ncbi:MAG TPA: hypothetical protein VMC02_02755 [Steroidobacteraceae bacterium]|nr:hypothetical protein [Steroidobacteraceae bacterium]